MPHFPSSQDTTSNEEEDREDRIRIRNRRKRYLELHPEYFKDSSLELAGRCTIHFLTFVSFEDSSPILYTDPLLYDRLIRRFQSAAEREKEGRERGYSGVLEANFVRSEAKVEALHHPDPNSPMAYSRAPDGSITAVEQDEGERALGPEDGWEKWKDVMGKRFVRGADGDFEYATVDENDEYDDRAEEDRRHLESYLNEEEERFVGEGRPTGQTGVQDY